MPIGTNDWDVEIKKKNFFFLKNITSSWSLYGTLSIYELQRHDPISKLELNFSAVAHM
jgi:hypothetical protein